MLLGDEVRPWYELMHSVAARQQGACGVAFFKVGVHNIQRIPRDTKFWRDVLLPVALRWVADVKAVTEGKAPPVLPPIKHAELPKPAFAEAPAT